MTPTHDPPTIADTTLRTAHHHHITHTHTHPSQAREHHLPSQHWPVSPPFSQETLHSPLPSLSSLLNSIDRPPTTASRATAQAQAWPVPAKVVRRILDFEYVEMSELLSEAWSTAEEESSCCHRCHTSRRVPINNILVWVECFSHIVAILASRYPDKTAQLMAY